jgi:hypothetical protein
MSAKSKKYYPLITGKFVNVMLLIMGIYIHYMTYDVLINIKISFNMTILWMLIVGSAFIIQSLRYLTTTYEVIGDKFVYTRLFGLLRTEAYLANITEYREYAWIVSSVQLYTYNPNPKKNHKFK